MERGVGKILTSPGAPNGVFPIEPSDQSSQSDRSDVRESRWRRYAAFVVVLGVVCMIAVFVNDSGKLDTFHQLPENQASAMDCILTWCRLNPFPASAKHPLIDVHGNPFTRGFSVYFDAPQKDIEKWLAESPGTKDAIISTPEPGVRLFKVSPYDASFAEVRVDDRRHRVWIRTYWS